MTGRQGITFRACYHLRQRALAILLRPQARTDLIRLGSGYGGWVVPSSVLDNTSICYSAGLGEDGSFDRELVAQFGCRVVVLDPTPRAIAYAQAQLSDVDLITFLPVGLWSTKSTLRFHAPKDPSHVSHSVVNLQGSSNYFEAPVISVAALMSDLGHRSITLLKLDIEGAEFEVISSLIRDGVWPQILCVEFDQPVPAMRVLKEVRRLRAFGFDLVNIDIWNYTFVHSGDPTLSGPR